MKSKWMIAAALLVACGGEGSKSEPVDALVVVQETNLTACQLPNSYEQMVTRACDSTQATVSVCSESELCQAQLDELTASIADCTNTSDNFTATSDATCD